MSEAPITKLQEFSRGWTVLVASAVGAATGVAVVVAYSFGALIGPLTEEFGWSRAEVTMAPLFTALGFLVAGAGVGGLADRFGALRVALVSQILLVFGLAAMSQLTRHLPVFYAAYFLLSVIGAGTLPMTWSRAVTGWFIRARGLALGLSLMGTGILGAFLPAYVSWLVAEGGWRYAFFGIAALPLVLGIPMTLLFFRELSDLQKKSAPAAAKAARPDQALAATTGHTLGEAASTWTFWLMSASFLLAAVAVSAVLAHAMLLLTDRGISTGVAAGLVGLFGMAVTAGRLLSGYLLDILKGPAVAVILFTIAGAACGLLAMGGTNAALCGAAIIMIGLAAGAEADIAAYFTAKFFGRAHYGAIYGLLYAIYCIGGGVGPSVVGAVYDMTKSYNVSLYSGVAVFLVAAVLAATIRAPNDRKPAKDLEPVPAL